MCPEERCAEEFISGQTNGSLAQAEMFYSIVCTQRQLQRLSYGKSLRNFMAQMNKTAGDAVALLKIKTFICLFVV